MQVVSVINYKGGVGKTTLTANLAAYLACLGKRVLLVDMDAQCSLTLSFMSVAQWKKLSDEGKTLKGWFKQVRNYQPGEIPDLLPLVVREKLEVNGRLNMAKCGGSISLIPSDIDLLDVDLDLAPMLYSLGNNDRETAEKFVYLHGILREHIHSSNAGEFDAVLVDCPPNFNIVTKTAIVASNAIVTPVVPDEMSTRGIRHLLAKCDELANGWEEQPGFNAYCEILGRDTLSIPNIRAIVPMIWKVTSRGDGALSEAHYQFVERLKIDLPDIVCEGGAAIINGFRHRASFFAKAGMIPIFMQPAADKEAVWGSVADTVQDVAAQLGWGAPNNVRLSSEWERLSQHNAWRKPVGWKQYFVVELGKLLNSGE